MASSVNKSKNRPNKQPYGSKMGSRNVEVRAVGAWVQPAPDNVAQYTEVDAVEAARIRQEEVQRKQEEKAARLQQFQQDVKRRVQLLDQARRQQQLQKSYKAVELERNIVKQSSVAAESAIPRKNHCTLRQEMELAINLRDDTEKSRQSSAPGKSSEYPLQNQTNKQKQRKSPVIPENETHQESQDNKGKPDAEEDNVEEDGAVEVQHVIGVLSESETKSECSSIHGSHIPNIYPGISKQEEKLQAQSQRAMYRRLFMDIEREQVKENMRRKEHKAKINRVKKEAEEERMRVESLAQEIIEPRDPITGETSRDSLLRRQREEAALQSSINEQQQRRQRNVETSRYLEALKQSLREKIKKQNAELPAMCCCGETVWDTNPDTCANNCVFYKNPKAYARALQSLLASCDVA